MLGRPFTLSSPARRTKKLTLRRSECQLQVAGVYSVSPLRRRMIEDMTIRKFSPKTQHDYVQRVKNFAAFLGRSPDKASFEDVRRYQLHLAASGAGVPTINQTVSTLRFLL